MKRKLIPLLLCLALLLGCLAGCGSEPAKVEIKESPAPTQTPEPTQAPAEETPAQETPAEVEDPEAALLAARYRAAYEKHDPDETVLLVNDEPITWSQYFSWLYDIASQVESGYGVTDWNAPREELANVVADSTFGSYVTSTVLRYILQVAVIGQKASELGITLSDDQRAEIDAEIDGYAERFGGMEGLEEVLASSYITMDYFRTQLEAMKLINNIYESLYGPDGENLPDEDAVAYLKDNDYLYAKHILFRTVDDSREPLPEEEAAQKKAEAEDVLAQLRACPDEDLPELFDTLMQQYSEDTGLIAYPDGYYFQAGEMVPAFEETVRELEENGMSDLVETDYGYHIIFCPPMSGEHVMGYDNNGTPYHIKAFVSAALFDSIALEWNEQAEQNVKFVPGFDNLDLNELLGTAEAES